MTANEVEVRGYTVHTQCYYAKTCEEPGAIETITIGFYEPDGCTIGEFEIRWESLDGDIVARLCAFDDGWSALFHCQDLLKELAAVNNTSPSPQWVIELLQQLGFKDLTKRNR